MKANKAKTSKKAVKKVTKRAVKKHLETSITDKFLEALKGLGHDAGKLSKEIKKTSRVLANKLADKYQEVKVAVEEKFESIPKQKRVKKTLTTAKKSITSAAVKAEKVVAKAVNIAASLKSKTAPKKATGARSTGTRAVAPKATASKPASTRKASTGSRTAEGTTAPSKTAGTRTAVKKTSAAGKAAPVKKVARARKPTASVVVTATPVTSASASGDETKTNS